MQKVSPKPPLKTFSTWLSPGRHHVGGVWNKSPKFLERVIMDDLKAGVSSGCIRMHARRFFRLRAQW